MPVRFERRFLNGKEIAKGLGVTPSWFYRHVRWLQEERRFPRPVIHNFYDPVAVNAWLDAQMAPELRAAVEAKASTA
jgi:hypothetical protein